VPEVAEWLHVHIKTVYSWIKEGKLEAIQFGSRTSQVPDDAVSKLLFQAQRVHM
jgi:excisionase family DNA binding protein